MLQTFPFPQLVRDQIIENVAPHTLQPNPLGLAHAQSTFGGQKNFHTSCKRKVHFLHYIRVTIPSMDNTKLENEVPVILLSTPPPEEVVENSPSPSQKEEQTKNRRVRYWDNLPTPPVLTWTDGEDEGKLLPNLFYYQLQLLLLCAEFCITCL